MADGALNVKLSEYSATKLAEKAKAMGVEPSDLAAMLLDDRLVDYNDFTWINGDPREPEPPYDPDEPTSSWEDVKARLLERLELKLAARK